MVIGREKLDKFWKGFLRIAHPHLQRALSWREKIRINEDTLHLILAGMVGVLGGLVNLLFYLVVDRMLGYAFNNEEGVRDIAQLAVWQRVLIPPVGGAAAGLILYWGLKLVGNQGASNILEVIVGGNGRLPVRTAVIKAVSSILSISTGASIGREGSITQLSATLASKGGTFAKWPPYRLRLLVACGAASGMSAAYNAPVAGAIFAAHIVLGNFSMNLFGPLVFSSVVATMVSRSFFGINPFYTMPDYNFTHFRQLPWFLVLGVISGFVAAGFLKTLRKSEDFFAMLKVPIFIRMAVSGLVVGILAVWFPNVWGNGAAAINEILHTPLTLWFIVGLFLAKTVATLATVGSGAVGGVFTPMLFIGASLGSIFGHLLNLGNLTSMDTGAFALVGMGSVLAAAVHAPLLAMIMMFEISLNYSIIPPLMLACTVAT
ncbi:MAG: chloride channel protein, partial [Verrucomicrobiales bacterium]